MDAEQTKLKREEASNLYTREEIQNAKSEIQAEMGERIKESRTEIEQAGPHHTIEEQDDNRRREG